MVIGRVKFIVSTTLPKPNEVDYWIDILEDPYGSVIRTWNGIEWRRIDQDAVDAIENFSLQLLQLDEKINNTIIELDTLTGEVRVLLDDLEQHVTNLDNPHNVTKEQVGLENVDNTSDMDKPVSTATLNELNKINQSVTSHVSDNNNPHTVTKAQVGLGNLTNDAQVKRSEMGVANGVAILDEQGLVPLSQLPSYVDDVIDCYATYNKAEDGALTNIRLYLDLQHQNAISGESGKIYVDITNSELITSSAYQFRWTGTQFAVVGAPTVIGEVTGTAFDGKRGKDLEDKTNALETTTNEHIMDVNNPHSVTKQQVGLGEVDNTSDANKPISNATQNALDAKQDTLVSGTSIKTVNGLSLLGEGDITVESGSGVGKVDTNSGGTGEIFNDYSGSNKALNAYSHAEGNSTTADGWASHAEGYGTTASGLYTHAEGSYTTTSGISAHAEGCYTAASGYGSHAGGCQGTANTYAQTVIGYMNTPEENPSPTVFDATKAAFIIGNDGNAFKVLFNGQTFADGNYSSTGADYAEMFEWLDGNPTNEDRVGRFVTLKGKNIEIANETSTYILGIVSGAPTIIGDNPMRWQGKYLNDEWGRPIYEDVERVFVRNIKKKDGTIETKEEVKVQHIRKVNPNYDPMERYIPRIERPEWDFVGMMGKLFVRQDGTLTEGGFCKAGANGVATKADNGYYVMEIINESQALILFK